MLIARIKGVDRKEKTKMVFGSKPNFVFRGVTYHVDPSCIYVTIRYVLFAFRTIDYVQGNSEPVGYYSEAWKKPVGTKNLDTISMIVKSWLTAVSRNEFILMILCLVAAIAAVISCVISYIRV